MYIHTVPPRVARIALTSGNATRWHDAERPPRGWRWQHGCSSEADQRVAVAHALAEAGVVCIIIAAMLHLGSCWTCTSPRTAVSCSVFVSVGDSTARAEAWCPACVDVIDVGRAEL